jgi:hypothetical protein
VARNGRSVAFESDATNLVEGDSNGQRDIFVYDRKSGRTTRASVSTSGTQSNSGSYFAALSGNGRWRTP